MEYTVVFEEKVALTPRDMNSVVEVNSIDMKILDYLKNKLEKKCSNHGYVLPDTLRLLSRSNGFFENGRFTGNILYYVQAQGHVYNPAHGTIVEGKVLKKNNMGLYVVYENAIRILVPRDLHIGDDEYDSVNVGETIRMEIRKSRFQVNDPFILSVAVYRGRAGEEETQEEESITPPAEEEESISPPPEEEEETA
jgi:DNA-directed RNA polymerase subunit E'/Rpb7